MKNSDFDLLLACGHRKWISPWLEVTHGRAWCPACQADQEVTGAVPGHPVFTMPQEYALTTEEW